MPNSLLSLFLAALLSSTAALEIQHRSLNNNLALVKRTSTTHEAPSVDTESGHFLPLKRGGASRSSKLLREFRHITAVAKRSTEASASAELINFNRDLEFIVLIEFKSTKFDVCLCFYFPSPRTYRH